jgi:hypothetical protein
MKSNIISEVSSKVAELFEKCLIAGAQSSGVDSRRREFEDDGIRVHKAMVV